MDRRGEASLIYWTGIWEPSREAISKEVSILRACLAPTAAVISFTEKQPTRWEKGRVLRLSGNNWWALRALAAVLEQRTDFHHVFGAMDAWHFLRALGRRPIVFTVVIDGPPLPRELYEKVACFAAESRALAKAVLEQGIDRARVHIVYPGVDLARYRPLPAPPGRFRIVFGSWPSQAKELEARGVRILIEAARLRPEVDFVLQRREWGDQRAIEEKLNEWRVPENILVERGHVEDMVSIWGAAHAVVCYFEKGFGKSFPNSILEGLACGRPALVADTCGIAEEIEEWKAGVVTPRTAADLARAIDRLRDDYAAAAAHARAAAERELDVARFCTRYAELYETFARK